jgi:GNAT superfamily N-acetyltransferase
MHATPALQLLGYAASALVAVSLMMKSLLRLRLINLAGASLMAAYGLFIHAYPVAVLNGTIVLVDLYYLQQMWRQRDYFKLLEVAHDSEYVRGFVDFHRAEIAEFVPDYRWEESRDHRHVLVLRNMVPAGLLVLRPEGAVARVLLDFVIPGYRDFGVGRFLFEENAAYFRERGVRRLVSAAGRPRHAGYLRRMGFRPAGDEYVRDLGGVGAAG